MKKIILTLILLILITGCAEKIEKPTENPEQQPSLIQEEAALEEIPEGEIQQEKIQEKTKEPEKTETKEEIIEEIKTTWPTFHGNNARTGFSESKAPSKPKVLWKWTLDDFMQIDYDGNFEGNWPIIDDGKVFIAPEDIFALDLKTGKKVWSYADEGRNFFPRGLAAGNGRIFVSVNAGDNLNNLPSGYVYALDENTGKFLWKYQTQKGVSHSLPLLADNKVFVGDDSGSIYALDSATGKLAWKKQLDAEVIHSSPAFDNEIIFVGTEGSQRSNTLPSYLYALKASDGTELWKFKVDYLAGKLNLIHSTPTILDNVVYVGAENGYFYALSGKDGSLIWKEIIASGSGELIGVSSAAAVGYGKIFIGTYEGKFLSLNQKDGKLEWEYNFGQANADSSPVLADNKVYFGVGEGGNGYFYSFNANTGDVIWKEKLGGSSGTLANGILIVHNKLAEENLKPETPIIIAFSDEGIESVW